MSVIMLQFNDVLLVCVAITLLPGVKQQYKVKAKLDISGMKVAYQFMYYFVFYSHISWSYTLLFVKLGDNEPKIYCW